MDQSLDALGVVAAVHNKQGFRATSSKRPGQETEAMPVRTASSEMARPFSRRALTMVRTTAAL